MALMDDPFPDGTAAPVTLSRIALSRASRRFRARVSVVMPSALQSNVDSILPRLPDSVDEVILADGGENESLRRGFAAARGDCVVFIDGSGEVDAATIERFTHALLSGAGMGIGHRVQL